MLIAYSLYLIRILIFVVMDHESRQIMLGLLVHEVLAEVDPVNCHPPTVEISHPPPTPPAIQFDTSSSFLTDQAFETRDVLLKWVRDVAAGLRFAVVIVNLDYGDGKRKQKLMLGYERGGAYKQTSKKTKFEDTGTRKCGCLFKLHGYFYNTTKD
jgi:hypothetical protein